MQDWLTDCKTAQTAQDFFVEGKQGSQQQTYSTTLAVGMSTASPVVAGSYQGVTYPSTTSMSLCLLVSAEHRSSACVCVNLCSRWYDVKNYGRDNLSVPAICHDSSNRMIEMSHALYEHQVHSEVVMSFRTTDQPHYVT